MTTNVDNFNRADAATLGTTSDGLKTWSDVAGSNGITSNQAALKTFGGPMNVALSTIAEGSADGTLQVTATAGPTSGIDAALAFRVADANNFLYFSARSGSGGGLWKFDSGANFTHLVNYSTGADGDILKVTCQGSTIHVYVNGAELPGSPVTNTFNQTVDAWGILTDIGARLDDWSWTSLPVPALKRLPRVVNFAALARASRG